MQQILVFDKFRFSGIFRDVYLLRRPKEHIVDYFINTIISGSNGILTFKNENDIDVLLNFCSKDYICKKNSPNELMFQIETLSRICFISAKFDVANSPNRIPGTP